MTREKKQLQKIQQWCHVGKLWRHFHFSNLQPIWSNPEAGFRMHSLNTYIFINSNLLSYKNWKQNYHKSQISITALTLFLWVKVLSWQKKMLIFCKRLRESWYWQVHFRKLHMCVYLRTKFEVSSILLMSFIRQARWWGWSKGGEWGYFTPPSHFKTIP